MGVSTDIAGNPVKGKDYTKELADLISKTSGGVSEAEADTREGGGKTDVSSNMIPDEEQET